MTEKKVKQIIEEIYPKIEKHYGFSKFQECTPYVELHKNIMTKLIWKLYNENMISEEVAMMLLDEHYK